MNRVVYGNRSGAAAWKCLAVSSQIENPAIQTPGEHAGYALGSMLIRGVYVVQFVKYGESASRHRCLSGNWNRAVPLRWKGTNGQENFGRSRVTSICRVRCKMRILPGWRMSGRSESSNLVRKQYL
jgi:hypothetical protein